MIEMIKSDGTCRNRGTPCLFRDQMLCECSKVNEQFKATFGKDCSDHYVYVKDQEYYESEERMEILQEIEESLHE